MAILMGGGVLSLIIVIQAFAILNFFRNRYLLRYKVSEGRFRTYTWLHFDKEIFKHAWSPAWRSALTILGSTGIIHFTGLLYSQVAESGELAAYLLSLKLLSSTAMFSQAPFYSKLPLFAKVRGQGNIKELVDLTSRAMFLSLTIFAVISFCVGLLGIPFLELFGSNTTLVSTNLWVVMSIVWFLERHHAMHAQIYATTNKIPFYIPISICGSVNLLLIFLYIDQFQVWVFPLAHGLSNLLINNWWNVMIAMRSVNQSFLGFFRRSAMIPTFVFIVLCWVLA